MKYFRKRALLALSVVVGFVSTTVAQTIPLDPDVVHGVMDNGMQYYILKNEKPENKAELRLAVNAGSLMETDAQQGIAHFCEHMAFNGSENFAKNELVDYLQSVGVKFGAHLNAYTSFDETVYMLSIPTDDNDIYKTGFQILEDWAHLVTYDGEEIDKERGVVLEEYRIGQGADKRMLAQYLPVLMEGSRYAVRLPIGQKEILENFEYKEARDFYKEWYRPDLMAVIVVGDVDVDKTKELIIKHFNGIKNPENAKEREIYAVPDKKESRAAVVTDAEAPYTVVRLNYNQDGVYKVDASANGYKDYLKRSVFTSMINERLSEISNQPGAPFSYVGSGFGTSWARSKAALQFFAISAEGRSLDVMKILVQEAERVRKHGFNQSEFDRAVKSRLAYIEKAYNERDKTESRRLCNELLNNFLEGEPAPGIEWEYEFTMKALQDITLDDVNALTEVLVTDHNKVAVITGPDKKGVKMPSEKEVVKIMDGDFDMDLSPLKEKQLPEQIMASMPEITKDIIVGVKKIDEIGAEKWKLSNGVTILVKQTDLKNDEVLMTAYSKGGTSIYPNDEYQKIRFGLNMIRQCGVGEYSEDDLDKIYKGKIVSVYPYIGETDEGMGGSCSPKDMEDMFQLINQFFAAPRKDNDAYLAYVNKQRTFYDNMLSNPGSYFSVKRSEWLFKDHPRSAKIPEQSDWDNTDYDLIYKVYQERFADPSDFTFVFVGNFDKETLMKYCKAYLGTLKTSGTNEEAMDVGMRVRTGPDTLMVYRGVDPKSSVGIMKYQETPYDEREAYVVKSLGELLTIKLIETLREEMSGVYGTSAYGGMARNVYSRMYFGIGFPCGPDNVDTLISAAIAELNKIVENGPEQKDVDKVKQAQLRELEQDVQRNRYWLNMLKNTSYYDDEYKTSEEKKAGIESLTAAEIQEIAKKYLEGDFLITVLMPESEKK